MQFSCSLFLRQWYDTRHKSLVLQSPQSFKQIEHQQKCALSKYRVLSRFFCLKKVGNKYLTIVTLIFRPT